MAPIPAFLGSSPFSYSELDNQTTNTNGYGASVQATDTQTVFGFNNHLVAGFSFDGAQTEFTGASFIGGITSDSRVVHRSRRGHRRARQQLAGSGRDQRRVLRRCSSPTRLNLTDRLALTASGRFNAAEINLNDQNGGDLTGNHYYQHFNPAAGVTYKVTPWLTAYAGYAEANRAPTPAELSCAGPNDSCSLANFFVGDPNLKQVVAHTLEAGVRGTVAIGDRDTLNYNLGLYRSNLDDDIIFVNSVTLNRAFFTNVGPDAPAGGGRQHRIQDAALVRVRSPTPIPTRPTRAASWRPRAATRRRTPTATSQSAPATGCRECRRIRASSG